MSFSLSRQEQTYNNGHPSGGPQGGGNTPKFVYPLISIDVTRAMPSNVGVWSAPNNNEVDLAVLNSLPVNMWSGFVDTTNFSQVRLIGHVLARGPDNSIARVKYSTTDADNDYHDLVAPHLDITTFAAGWSDSGWRDIVSAAIGPLIYVRMFSVNQGNDGSNYTSIMPLELWFR